MPSTISFLPAPAPASASTPSASTPAAEQSSGDSQASFDSLLNQAAPAASSQSGSRASVTGSARPTNTAAENATADDADEATDELIAEVSADGSTRSLLSPEELAALLALMSPAALQPPPLPANPVSALAPTLDPACSTASDTFDSFEATGAAPSIVSGAQFRIGSARDAARPEVSCREENMTEGTFALAGTPGDTGLSARDLLKNGAEVLDYQLQPPQEPSPASAAVSPAAVVPGRVGMAPAQEQPPADSAPIVVVPVESAGHPGQTPAASRLVTTGDSAVESATFAQQSSAPATQPLDGATNRRFRADKTAIKAQSEKIAAPVDSGVSTGASGVKSSIAPNKNNFLPVDNKVLVDEERLVGTDAANWGDPMNPDARSTPLVARLIDGALSLFGTSLATAGVDRPSGTAATSPVSPAQAAQIVGEIRDIADGLWAVERNSVEVRFNFSETERLSVKVEYRDGVVQTTFRTDSPGLRDTIAREWQSQVASASDARPYRVADPVFNTPPADARGFSMGGDSSRQQRQAEQSGQSAHTFATTSGRGSSSSSAVAAVPATAFARPDTALHLHAFA
jgi:hypothetical protein